MLISCTQSEKRTQTPQKGPGTRRDSETASGCAGRITAYGDDIGGDDQNVLHRGIQTCNYEEHEFSKVRARECMLRTLAVVGGVCVYV